MKTLLCTVAMFSLLGLRVQAQDTINLTNGESKTVKILKVTEDRIEFNYLGETVINDIPKSKVSHVIFESGRREDFTEVVEIGGEEDWEKVKIIGEETHIDPAAFKIHKTEVRRHAIPFGSQKAIRKILVEKIKREAARESCPYVKLDQYSFDRTPVNMITVNVIFYKQ